MNPYESPLSECDPSFSKEADPPGPDTFLVSLSLLLAILIEVFPTETDLIVVSRLKGMGIVYLLMIKAIALIVILAPLAFYVLRHGRRGIKHAKGKITAIGIIIALNFTMDLIWIVS